MKRTHWLMPTLAAACSAAGVAHADVYDVALQGMDFVYNGQTNMNIDLTINTGDTVRWTWVSGFHNVVSGLPSDSDAGDLFSSGAPTGTVGTMFEYTFNDVGLFNYHCQIHATLGMMSQVTVVPAPGALALLAPVGLLATRRRR